MAKDLGVTAQDDVLFAVFSESDSSEGDITSKPNKNSALCVYSLKSIRRKFMQNIQRCFTGNKKGFRQSHKNCGFDLGGTIIFEKKNYCYVLHDDSLFSILIYSWNLYNFYDQPGKSHIHCIINCKSRGHTCPLRILPQPFPVIYNFLEHGIIKAIFIFKGKINMQITICNE